MMKTENTTTGLRAVLGGVFGARAGARADGNSGAAVLGYLPAR